MPQAPKSGVDDMKQTTLTKSCKQALWACWRLSVLIFLGEGCQTFLQGEEKRLLISFTVEFRSSMLGSVGDLSQ